MSSVSARVERVVRGVVAAAVRESGAKGVVILDDWTAEGELLCEWLVRELGEARVWRVASLASNVQNVAAGADAQAVAAARAAGSLLAHPANRTGLLLGGALPRADLLPFGDVTATQMEMLAGGWTVPAEVEQVAMAAGGMRVLDAALTRWVDERRPPEEALAELDAGVARRVRELYERGRYWRVRPRLVPKLSARTIGVDLFD